jgi:hypothetical protein
LAINVELANAMNDCGTLSQWNFAPCLMSFVGCINCIGALGVGCSWKFLLNYASCRVKNLIVTHGIFLLKDSQF